MLPARQLAILTLYRLVAENRTKDEEEHDRDDHDGGDKERTLPCVWCRSGFIPDVSGVKLLGEAPRRTPRVL